MDLLKKIVGGMLKRVSLKAKGEMKMTKRILAGLAIGMMVSGVAMAATESGETVSIEITVTCAPGASVWIGDNAYPFGSINMANTASVAATSIAVDNDSAGLTERYQLRASNARNDGNHSTPTDWNLAVYDGEAADTYSLGAVFAAARPGDGDFGADDDLLNDNQVCDGVNQFGGGGHTKAAADAPEHLWFRIKTPTSVQDTNVHTIYVTIVALEM